MSYGYRTLIDIACLDEIPSKGKKREKIIRFCEELSHKHSLEGDIEVKDPVLGYDLQVSLIEGYQIFWWVDHADKRAIVVKIRKVGK